jgi:hypothetical protein
VEGCEARAVSREERTGWRSEWISRRHREWDGNCPFVDFDFVGIEFDRGAPRSVVEYKDDRAQPVDMMHPAFRAMRTIADGDHKPLPFLVARYRQDVAAFKVFAANDAACDSAGLPLDGEIMSERDYVGLLYHLRGRPLPSHLARKLGSDAPSRW